MNGTPIASAVLNAISWPRVPVITASAPTAIFDNCCVISSHPKLANSASAARRVRGFRALMRVRTSSDSSNALVSGPKGTTVMPSVDAVAAAANGTRFGGAPNSME
jgi:hypothetical protein